MEYLRVHSFATVSGLARELECSEMTIRRDLDRLASRGKVERRHGGAMMTGRVKLEFTLGEKAKKRRLEKVAIAKAAAELIQPGQRIFVDTGTTLQALAWELRHREGIRVVTTSLAVVSVLLSARGVECMLLGGIVREQSPDLYGPLLEDNLSKMHPDWAFIGCDGISVKGGLTTDDPRVAHATSLVVANASRVALLTDSSKAREDSFVTFARMEDVDVLVTDKGMPAEILDAARAAGAETVIVEVEEGA